MNTKVISILLTVTTEASAVLSVLLSPSIITLMAVLPPIFLWKEVYNLNIFLLEDAKNMEE